jgi:chromosome condensin MukBEF MukE localization factor
VRLRTFFLLVSSGLAIGCGSRRAPIARQEPAHVEVDNRTLVDRVVFAIEGGRRIRLGIVTANTTSRLRIPDAMVGLGREVQFVTTTIGRDRTASSEQMFVRPGEVVQVLVVP